MEPDGQAKALVQVEGRDFAGHENGGEAVSAPAAEKGDVRAEDGAKTELARARSAKTATKTKRPQNQTNQANRNNSDESHPLGKERSSMPGGARTGPLGLGPMTGRGAGFCAGFPVPGFASRWIGAGWGWMGQGRGGGRGWRRMFSTTGLTGWQRAGYPMGVGWPAWAFPTSPGPAGPSVPPGSTRQQQIELLKRQAEFLSSALGEIQKRIDELQAQPEQS